MKDYLRSYFIYLSNIFTKIMIFVIYPIVTIGFAGLITIAFMKNFIIGLIAAVFMIIILELFLDYFVYGGILNRNTCKMEYLKTSYKCMNILKKSILTDKIRRILTISIILSVIYAIRYEGMDVLELISVILGVSIVVESVLLLSRFMDNIVWVISTSFLGYLLGILMLVMTLHLPKIFLILLIAGCIGVWWGSNWFIMKRVKGGYYDV